MTRRTACLPATVGKRWKRFSSMSRADASARPCDDRQPLPILAEPCRRHGAALLVSAALVLAAYSRSHLLADGADADVGLSAALRVAELRHVCPRRRRVHRRGAAVGYPVPRPTRLLHFLP